MARGPMQSHRLQAGPAHTALKPGSLFWFHAVMSLQFTDVRSFSCKDWLGNQQADCIIVGLYCVTMTWQQIFTDSLLIMAEEAFCRM